MHSEILDTYVTGPSSLGVPGVPRHTQILADQLSLFTVFQPGGTDFAHPITTGTQRAKITEKVHKPPQNHYIEWPVFSDIGLNCVPG